MLARGAAYVFLPVPAKQTIHAQDVDLFTRQFIPRLVQELSRRGILALDLTALFQAHREKGLYRPADTHWTGQATRIATAELVALLRGSGLLEAVAHRTAKARQSRARATP